MTEPIAFESRRFRIAEDDLWGRPHHAPEPVRRVAELCSLIDAYRLLDLSCGSVGATDPGPEMLRIAASTTEGTGPEGTRLGLGPTLLPARSTRP